MLVFSFLNRVLSNERKNNSKKRVSVSSNSKRYDGSQIKRGFRNSEPMFRSDAELLDYMNHVRTSNNIYLW